jgi:hypothetical protein
VSSEARQLAALAWALQRRLEALSDDVDPSWHGPLARMGGLEMAVAGEARGRVVTTLFRQYCGPLPPLGLLAESASRLALLDREQLLSRLCALALLGRLGVLRCCVEQQARAALHQHLGPAYEVLKSRGARGAAVRGEVATWAPLAWSWVGYRELEHAQAWPHPSLRKLARLALPTKRSGEPPSRLVPAASSPPLTRLAELDALFDRGAAPC